MPVPVIEFEETVFVPHSAFLAASTGSPKGPPRSGVPPSPMAITAAIPHHHDDRMLPPAPAVPGSRARAGETVISRQGAPREGDGVAVAVPTVPPQARPQLLTDITSGEKNPAVRSLIDWAQARRGLVSGQRAAKSGSGGTTTDKGTAEQEDGAPPPPCVMLVQGPHGCGKTETIRLIGAHQNWRIANIDPSAVLTSPTESGAFWASEARKVEAAAAVAAGGPTPAPKLFVVDDLDAFLVRDGVNDMVRQLLGALTVFGNGNPRGASVVLVFGGQSCDTVVARAIASLGPKADAVTFSRRTPKLILGAIAKAAGPLSSPLDRNSLMMRACGDLRWAITNAVLLGRSAADPSSLPQGPGKKGSAACKKALLHPARASEEAAATVVAEDEDAAFMGSLLWSSRDGEEGNDEDGGEARAAREGWRARMADFDSRWRARHGRRGIDIFAFLAELSCVAADVRGVAGESAELRTCLIAAASAGMASAASNPSIDLGKGTRSHSKKRKEEADGWTAITNIAGFNLEQCGLAGASGMLLGPSAGSGSGGGHPGGGGIQIGTMLFREPGSGPARTPPETHHPLPSSARMARTAKTCAETLTQCRRVSAGMSSDAASTLHAAASGAATTFLLAEQASRAAAAGNGSNRASSSQQQQQPQSQHTQQQQVPPATANATRSLVRWGFRAADVEMLTRVWGKTAAASAARRTLAQALNKEVAETTARSLSSSKQPHGNQQQKRGKTKKRSRPPPATGSPPSSPAAKRRLKDDDDDGSTSSTPSPSNNRNKRAKRSAAATPKK